MALAIIFSKHVSSASQVRTFTAYRTGRCRHCHMQNQRVTRVLCNFLAVYSRRIILEPQVWRSGAGAYSVCTYYMCSATLKQDDVDDFALHVLVLRRAMRSTGLADCVLNGAAYHATVQGRGTAGTSGLQVPVPLIGIGTLLISTFKSKDTTILLGLLEYSNVDCVRGKVFFFCSTFVSIFPPFLISEFYEKL